MAGHSKWKNIRIRKGKQDAVRGKTFTKASREIIIAAKMGGGDPANNARLRAAIEKARELSVPAENIKRSIQRGTGEIEGADYEEITYEGYGPAGSALIVECYTENRNRTVADLRHAFSKHGGNMSENGSVSWQFKNLGEITVPDISKDEDELTLIALDLGAEDLIKDEEGYTIYTPIEQLHAVNDGLNKQNISTSDPCIVWIPSNKTDLDTDALKKLVKLLNVLDDLDDVKDTYVNVDIPEEMFEE